MTIPKQNQSFKGFPLQHILCIMAYVPSRTDQPKKSRSLQSASEGSSSGYDSDCPSESAPLLCHEEDFSPLPDWNRGFYDRDSDSESDDLSSCFSTSFSECYDSDDDDFDSDEVISYNSTASLTESLQQVLMMPHLSDLVFYVGIDRVPIYAIRAVTAVRSRVLHQMIMFATKSTTDGQTERTKNKFGKKKKNSSPRTDKLHIVIDNCNTNDFRSLIEFIHTGTIKLATSNVIGIFSAASKYDVPELRDICRDFVDRCTSHTALAEILKMAKRFHDERNVQKLLNKVYNRLDSLVVSDIAVTRTETTFIVQACHWNIELEKMKRDMPSELVRMNEIMYLIMWRR